MFEHILFLLVMAVANAFLINGLHKAFMYEIYDPQSDRVRPVIDMTHSGVLGWIHFRFRDSSLVKPLFACAPCMASIHSLYIFWPVVLSAHAFSPWFLLVYALYIPLTAGISAWLNKE